MMKLLRRRKRGQSLVIIALSATVLFGIIALGLDAGRLYFQRRDVQNAADAGALAGAQELIPNTPDPNGDGPKARCMSANYALKLFNMVPAHDCSSSNLNGFWSSGNTVTDTASGDPTTRVRSTTPSRGMDNEIETEVFYTVPTTFASVLGFRSSQVYAVAYAHGGFYNKTYTIFGFDAGGSGNSIIYDQNGYGQVDNGNNGTDCATPDVNKGKLVSNAKFHVPNPNQPYMNLNGVFYYAQASDTHALVLYWFKPVSPSSTPPDPAPNYEAPPASGTVNPATGVDPITGATIYYPGIYTQNVSISSGRNIFTNGLYFFQGADLTISGTAVVGNTTDALPKYNNVTGDGMSNLVDPNNPVNGVEFIFDGNGAQFSATGKAKVFFVAPSAGHVPSGTTDSIAFFIKKTDTISGPNGTPWSETVDGTQGGQFEVWGTVYNQDVNGSHGTVAVIQGVASNGRGGAKNPGHYAVNGEFISPQVDVRGGNLTTNSSIGATACYQPQPAALIVQYNPNFAPHFRGFSYLVK